MFLQVLNQEEETTDGLEPESSSLDPQPSDLDPEPSNLDPEPSDPESVDVNDEPDYTPADKSEHESNRVLKQAMKMGTSEKNKNML